MMSIEAAQSIFDKMIAGETDAAKIEWLEKLRDQCELPEFREQFYRHIMEFTN